ncbi:MAG TPA: S4 domain-containing protein, partial [Acidimicrobiales bacterium]|nr:S4 domain-containing protein [Acidimicrobiales bacterium]
MTQLHVEMSAALDGQRVDRVLAMLTGVPRRVAAELVARGAVRLDGRVVTSRSTAVRSGQVLDAEVVDEGAPAPAADASVPFSVVYEDDDLVVVDKPAGVVVHHGAGHRGGTLVDGLL